MYAESFGIDTVNHRESANGGHFNAKNTCYELFTHGWLSTNASDTAFSIWKKLSQDLTPTQCLRSAPIKLVKKPEGWPIQGLVRRRGLLILATLILIFNTYNLERNTLKSMDAQKHSSG